MGESNIKIGGWKGGQRELHNESRSDHPRPGKTFLPGGPSAK